MQFILTPKGMVDLLSQTNIVNVSFLSYFGAVVLDIVSASLLDMHSRCDMGVIPLTWCCRCGCDAYRRIVLMQSLFGMLSRKMFGYLTL